MCSWNRLDSTRRAGAAPSAPPRSVMHPARVCSAAFAWLLLLLALAASSDPAGAQIPDIRKLPGSIGREVGKQTQPPQKASAGDLPQDLLESPAATAYVRRLLDSLQAHGDSGAYELTLQNTAWVQAWSRTRGERRVGITRGMLNAIQNEAELAGLLGHEIMHRQLGHGTERDRDPAWKGAAGGIIKRLPGSVRRPVEQQVNEVANTRWSREQEHNADFAGAELAARAGYDPYAYAELFDRLAQSVNASTLTRLRQDWKGTHETPETRAANLRKHLRQKGYPEGQGTRAPERYQHALAGLHGIPTTECEQGALFGAQRFWPTPYCQAAPAWPMPVCRVAPAIASGYSGTLPPSAAAGVDFFKELRALGVQYKGLAYRLGGGVLAAASVVFIPSELNSDEEATLNRAALRNAKRICESGENYVIFYRGVYLDEAAQIAATGKLQPDPRGNMEFGKHVTNTQANAAKWGFDAVKDRGGEFKVVEILVPESDALGFDFLGLNVDDFGPAWFAPYERLQRAVLRVLP